MIGSATHHRRLGLITLALLLGVTLPASGAYAADQAGVAALLKQAQYWRAKGREDLAQQALNRARALDPDASLPTAVRPVPTPSKPEARAKEPALAPQSPRPAAAPVSSSAVRAGQARVSGFDALEAGDLASAGAQFERALAANRRDPDALGGLGLVRLRQGRFADAASLLEQASQLGKADQWASGLAAARYFAGIDDARALIEQGRIAEAQSEAEQLVAMHYSQPAPALELLADIYEQQGRHTDAAQLYGQASMAGGEDAKRLQVAAARASALAAADRGDDAGADRGFQQGLLLAPKDPWIRYAYAKYLIGRGRIAESDAMIGSLALSGEPEALYAAALLDASLKRTAEAGKLIDRIPDAQRTTAMRQFAIGVKTDAAIVRAHEMATAGQQDQAIIALRQLGAMPGLAVGKQAEIAQALLDLGAENDAANLAARAATQPVDDVAEYEGLVSVLAQTGRADLAQMLLQRAGASAGNSPDGQRAYARMGAALAVGQADKARQAGNFAEAYDLLQQAWMAAPDGTDTLAALGRLYQSGNMPDRAAQTWQLLLQRTPGDREGLLGLAQSAAAAGDRDLSKQAENQALAAFSNDYEVCLRLADAAQTRGDKGTAMRLLKQARALYTRSQAGSGSQILQTGNPFANSSAGIDAQGSDNPFRAMAATQQAPTVNPFALSGGTRLPATAMMGYGGGVQRTMQAIPVAAQAPVGGRGPSGWAPANVPVYGTAPANGAQFGGNAVSGAQGGSSGVYSRDPVMAQIQSEIAELAQDTGPRLEVSAGYRGRSGETGLSKLDEIDGTTKISTSAAGGRVYARADAVVIDAGRPTGSGLARFGRNGTIEAQAIVDQEASALVQADTQHHSGVAFAAGYESGTVQAEVGTTPVGMGDTKVTFRAAVTPKLSETVSAKAWVERKPVTDSVVSYAGATDPVTGERWGQVMRLGGGAGLSYDESGNGFYAEGRYNRYSGLNVRRNSGFEGNVGGYLRVMHGPHSSMSAGLNVNYQSYDHNENEFTYGSGGYFSPQSFLSVSFPINYSLDTDSIELRASVTPGFQSYSQEQTALYPTDPDAQAELDALKAQDSDVRSYYDSMSKTGFALSAQGSLYYRVGSRTKVGGEASYNSFGSYDEFRSMIGLRQSFGSGAE